MTDSNTAAVEVWFQHPKCGTVFQDSGGKGECAHCTGMGVKVDLTRHEFPEGSPEFVRFLADAQRVYTSTRLRELTRLVEAATAVPTAASP